ncbi:MAG: hypothetical protein AAF700_08770 [Pseudomonadota bacterium]
MVDIYRPSLAEMGIAPTKIENAFLKQCKQGREFSVAGTRPTQKHPGNTIRAEIIRFLILGGSTSHPVHPRGVRLCHAFIEGQLDLVLCRSQLALKLKECTFSDPVHLFDADLYGIDLQGSHCPGIEAYRLRTSGPVILENGFTATGPLDFDYARIGGRLGLKDAVLKPESETAFTGIGLWVGHDMAFSGQGTRVFGRIDLTGARLQQQLLFTGASLRPPAHLKGVFRLGALVSLEASGIHIGSDLFLRSGFNAAGKINLNSVEVKGQASFMHSTLSGAVILTNAKVEQKFFWKDVSGAIPEVDLRHARLGILEDDIDSWRKVDALKINGLIYDDIESAMSTGERLEWLEMDHGERSFDYTPFFALRKGVVNSASPQPYAQRARVLDKVGLRLEAANIRYAQEHNVRRTQYARARKQLEGPFQAWKIWHVIKMQSRRGLDVVFNLIIGYGHKPARAILATLFIWCIGISLYGQAYTAGHMVPNSPVILVSKDWREAVSSYEQYKADNAKWATPDPFPLPQEVRCAKPVCFWEASRTHKDYETFNRFAYAFDLFVPLVELGQEAAWSPTTRFGGIGKFAYWMRWPIQMAGWIITAVGAATLTGLVGRKE